MATDQSIGVFVDIASLHKNIKRLYQAKLDYRKYLHRIELEGEIYRAFAYGTQVENEADKFISFLRSINFQTKYTEVRRKKLKAEDIYRDMEKVFKLKEDDNVFKYLEAKVNEDSYNVIQYSDKTIDIIVDIMRLIDRLDIIVIGSSNINIVPLIKLLKERGIKVIVFSCNIPYQLKQEADLWWEITDRFLEERPEEEKKDELVESTV